MDPQGFGGKSQGIMFSSATAATWDILAGEVLLIQAKSLISLLDF